MNSSTVTNRMLDKHQGCLDNRYPAISSLKIAFLTGRQHNVVLNDVRRMVNELVGQDINSNAIQRCYRVERLLNHNDRCRPHHHFLLRDLLAHTLLAGYPLPLPFRLKLIRQFERHFGRQ